jgi:hypothetical protein
MAVWDIKERYKKARANEIRGNRGFWSAGAVVSYINVSSAGDAVDFGDMSQDKSNKGGIATPTRVIFGGGYTSPAGKKLEHFTPTSLGNGADFGDLSTTRSLYGGAASNHIRGIFMGGEGPAPGHAKVNVIDYITIASLGDASDFGDLTSARYGGGGIASSTRVCLGGGFTGSNSDVIDYGTIASTGDFADFGDLTSVRRGCPGANSTTRGLIFKGADASSPEPDQKFIDYFEIATTGNASDFGDATVLGRYGGALSNNIRGVSAGGADPSTNTIDYVTITTAGNAADFGDLLSTTNPTGACVGHGGLDLDVIQRPSVTYMPGSGRGFTNAGTNSGGSAGSINRIQMTHIPTLGNAIDFGDCVSRQLVAGVSSVTRSVIMGGESPSAVIDTMDSFEHASLGNAADFGNLSGVRRNMSGGGGNSTRGICAGGNTPSLVDIIEYITFTTAGNATDFGNLGAAAEGVGTCSGGTRTVHGGGKNPSGEINIIEYTTTASTGNATDFGDLTDARRPVPASSLLRAVFMGGYSPGRINIIDYVTIASTGDASDFGDLTIARAAGAGLSNSTRAIHSGGEISGGDTVNQDYITIASTGDAADFGDLVEASQYHSGTSDSHGGLQG